MRAAPAVAFGVPISHALCPQGRTEALGMRDSTWNHIDQGSGQVEERSKPVV